MDFSLEHLGFYSGFKFLAPGSSSQLFNVSQSKSLMVYEVQPNPSIICTHVFLHTESRVCVMHTEVFPAMENKCTDLLTDLEFWIQ